MATLTLDVSIPNPVLDIRMSVIVLEEDPSGSAHIGVFEIDTEQGVIPLVMNRKAAAAFMHELTAFLAAEAEEPVEAAND